MRWAWIILLPASLGFCQKSSSPQPANSQTEPAVAQPAAATAASQDANAAVIPAGSRIPLLLKQAISTKNAREGDAVYAETAFPFVLNERVLVPAGTYVLWTFLPVPQRGS